jgi:hypothetical protein
MLSSAIVVYWIRPITRDSIFAGYMIPFDLYQAYMWYIPLVPANS